MGIFSMRCFFFFGRRKHYDVLRGCPFDKRSKTRSADDEEKGFEKMRSNVKGSHRQCLIIVSSLLKRS